MKKFYEFTEQILLTLEPTSDSVGAVEHEEEKPTDMFTSTADGILKNLGVQPDDDVGETGENQSEGEDSTTNGVELTCMGEKGVQVKFNGLEMILPKEVIEAIKGFETTETKSSCDNTEESNEGEEESKEETDENNETAEDMLSDKENEETKEDDEDNKKTVTDSIKYVQRLIESKKGKAVNPWAVCNKSTGGKKKVGKDKFERCVMDVKKKHKIKESILAPAGTPIVYKLKRKSDWNEWVVAAYINGKFDEDKSYFTDDKQDAINTLAYMQKTDPVVKG